MTAGPDSAMTPRFRVLGPVEARDADGRLVSLSDNQQVAMALLISGAGRTVPSDRLVTAIWPGQLPADPGAALRNLVSRLRRLLGAAPGILASEGNGYRFTVPPDEVDWLRFETLLEEASRASGAERDRLLAQALALWRGDAFAGLAGNELLQAEARRLDELRAQAREGRGNELVDLGRAAEAISDLEALIHAEPQREHARGLLMRALAAVGRHTDALRLYQQWCDELAVRGLEPSPVLRQVEVDVLRHTATPARPTRSRRSALPRPISSLVGREDDLAKLVGAIGMVRLITLVGVGGVGKTRLALAAADAVASRYPDGVWFCDLSPANDPADAPALAATTIGLAEQGNDPLDRQLADHLDGAKALVILDNCERVLAGAGGLAQTLTTYTAGVDVLATSRQRLGADGELAWPVDPLAAGDPGSPAARLFIDRRRSATSADDRVGPAEALVIARVCRKLDGLPLAIELAAARSRGMDLRELERRWDQRFTILVESHRTQSRHRSLAAMIDWSHDDLDPQTRTVFRRLGIFRSSFDLDVAGQVLSATGLDPTEVARAVLVLVDCSLLRWNSREHESPYSMLDSIREYAVDQMRQAGDHQAVSAAHAAWAVQFSEAMSEQLVSADEVQIAASLYRHLDDLRAAVEWLNARKDPDAARLVSALHFFALWRSESEIFRWAELIAAGLADSGSALLPAARAASGRGAWQRGDLESARRAAEPDLSGGNPTTQEATRRLLELAGDVALQRGELITAIDCYQRGRDLALQAGDLAQAIWDEGSRALAHSYGGERQPARAASETTMDLARRTGSPSALGFAHFVAAEVELHVDPNAAEEHLRRAATLTELAGSRYISTLVDLSLASLAERAGEITTALNRYQAILTAWQQARTRTGLQVTLRSLVMLLCSAGAARDAAVLYGAVAHPTNGAVLYGTDAARLAWAGAELTKKLGRAAFADLITAGRQLTEDELCAEALCAVRAARPTVANDPSGSEPADAKP